MKYKLQAATLNLEPLYAIIDASFSQRGVNVKLVIALLILAVGGFFAGCREGSSTTATTTTATTTKQVKLEHGPQDAKVKIVCFYPFNEKHLALIGWLNDTADRYPGKVHVTAWDFTTKEGGAETQKAFGMLCGGITINGKTDFTAKVDGKMTEISTMKGEWVGWTKPEVEAAIDQIVQEQYPGTKALPAKK